MTTAAPTSIPPTTLAPTTLAPTSLAPTTMLTTAVPTTAAPTTVPPSTGPPTTPPPHNALNDVTFNCWAYGYAGVPMIEVTIAAAKLESTHYMGDLELGITVSISGTVPIASLVTDATIGMTVAISGDAIANREKANWVAWSKIGDVSMVLDRVNDAGRRPMEWPGFIYQTKRLNKEVIIYGSGGVSAAYPVSSPAPTFGFRNVSEVGVKNKTAIDGDDKIHFYIDIEGCLWVLAIGTSVMEPLPKLQRLGYEEFLLPLVNPVLLYDKAKRRLYISDANTGYIFNEGAMTGGYRGLTGLYRVKEDLTLVGPDTIIADPVEIWTDILDFEHSGLKSIESIFFNANADIPMQAAIQYRYENQKEFKQTEWTPVNRQGVAHRRIAGTEFRIGLRCLDTGTFDISSMKINYKYIDQRFTRDPRDRMSMKEY